MRRRIVAGNWKMNGSMDLVTTLVPAVSAAVASGEVAGSVVIFPPALYVPGVLKAAGGELEVGVQNVSQWRAGAYTGDLSAVMAADTGCHYALVGHSERRQYFGETDAVVALKVRQALDAGLVVMVCVGETLAQRDAGDAESVVASQVRAALADVTQDEWARVVVAYEPVWAIGTGKTATAEDAQAMHASIRQVLGAIGAPADDVSVLYGGSVKADNAPALFAEADIDGGLIGGASLSAEEFVSICRSLPADDNG
ncbi:triose-phosphate isomerase [Marinobacter sp. C2H3]|uniref:triose-phosphate isomerase n=1 Tax=Marinobacter sp. C2H3 TaxID=3119003 RepID=UPI00300EA6B4